MPARVSSEAPRILTTKTATALCAELALFVKLGLDLGELAHSFRRLTILIMRLAAFPRQFSRDGRWNLISADFTARKGLAALQLQGAAPRGCC
jgi:hypothetical protein